MAVYAKSFPQVPTSSIALSNIQSSTVGYAPARASAKGVDGIS